MTLKHAILYKSELDDLAAEILVKDKYKYFNLSYFSLPTVDRDEWNNITFVSYTDKVIGFFSASVSRANDIISNVSMWSAASTYYEYKVFEKDLLSFFLYLLKRFEVLSWEVITKNPVRKKYRKFTESVGGNIVGIQHGRYKIFKERVDAELYELFSSSEVIKKVTKLRDRIKV